MTFSKQITQIVKNLNYVENNVGRSGDKVFIFENKYVLKISKNISRLEREKEKIDWLKDKLPVPQIIAFEIEDNKAYLLETFMQGKTLIDKDILKDPILVCSLLAKAINLLSSPTLKNSPFSCPDSQGLDFVHGDLCLPNILTDGENITGFIDLESSGLGDKWFDISWSIWSLCYNLGTNDYIDTFLSMINQTFDSQKFDKFIPKNNKNLINL
ncbi:MAG: phosphotransferase [Clostridia bacterium]|nr:phosphotransferase [Clostridia bacterium]